MQKDTQTEAGLASHLTQELYPDPFIGRTYLVKGGYKNWAVRFADGDKSGVATTAYSYKMSDIEREIMNRRIAAALMICKDKHLDELETEAYGV